MEEDVYVGVEEIVFVRDGVGVMVTEGVNVTVNETVRVADAGKERLPDTDNVVVQLPEGDTLAVTLTDDGSTVVGVPVHVLVNVAVLVRVGVMEGVIEGVMGVRDGVSEPEGVLDTARTGTTITTSRKHMAFASP